MISTSPADPRRDSQPVSNAFHTKRIQQSLKFSGPPKRPGHHRRQKNKQMLWPSTL